MALCHRCQAVEVELQEQHIAALQVDPMEPLVSIEQAAQQLGLDASRVRTWMAAHRVPGLGPPVYRKRPRFPRTLSRVLRPQDVRMIGAYALRRLRTHHQAQAITWPGDTDGTGTAAERARQYRRARSGAQP